MRVPSCLTIASSDSGGGAGIAADLRAFAAAGCHGTTAIVAVTVQNTVELRRVHELPADLVVAQCEAVLDDIGAAAIKTGMLVSVAIVEAVAGVLEGRGLPLVVDPVLAASTGGGAMGPDGLEALRRRLLPLATVVTPNLPEARALAGGGAGSRAQLAETLHGLGAAAVLITGGHGDEPWDHLYDGVRHTEIRTRRHPGGAGHGSGCTHSATLAALLARGAGLEEAARGAAEAAAAAIGRGLAGLGAGEGPVDVLDLRRPR